MQCLAQPDADHLLNNWFLPLPVRYAGKRQIVYAPFTQAPDSSPGRAEVSLPSGLTDHTLPMGPFCVHGARRKPLNGLHDASSWTENYLCVQKYPTVSLVTWGRKGEVPGYMVKKEPGGKT